MALTDSLIDVWEMEESGGTRVGAHAGITLTDNLSTGSAAGIVAAGTAANFVASSFQFLSAADSAALSTGDIDFTISLWVYLTRHSPPIMAFVVKGDSGFGDGEYQILHADGPLRFIFSVLKSPSTQGNAVSSVAPSINTWYHIVAWHDAVNDQLGIAVNDGTPDLASHSAGLNDSSVGFRVSSSPAAAGIWFIDGRIDQVAFWKRVLTSGERTALYNGGAGLAYPFAAAAAAKPWGYYAQQRGA